MYERLTYPWVDLGNFDIDLRAPRDALPPSLEGDVCSGLDLRWTEV